MHYDAKAQSVKHAIINKVTSITMIVQENITINDKLFVKTYSDAEFYIKKKGTDEVYVEAIDLPTSNFEYVETEDKIEKPEEVDTENEQLMQ